MATQIVERRAEIRLEEPVEGITLAPSTEIQPMDLQPLEIADEGATPDSAEPEYPRGLKLWLITLAMGSVLILGALDTNIVATAVPAITDHFHTVADVGWYSSAYRLTICSFQFMFGKLFQIFSIKRVFLAAVTIFLTGSTLCASATSSAMFVVGRAICGFGTSGVIAGCFVQTMLVHTVPLRQRPVYTSLLGFVETIAVAVAPILGGVLTQQFSWRWCFWISLPIGAVTLVILALFLTDPKKSASAEMTWKQIFDRLDLIGNLVFVPAITSLFLALSYGGTRFPWSDPKIIGLLVTFAALLAVFAWEQHRKQDAATLPPRLIKQRSVIAGCIFSFCCNASLNVIEYYMPTYFQSVRGWTPARSGYMMLPIIVGQSMGFILCGAGTSMSGYYTPFMLIGSVLSPIAAGLMTTWKVHSSLPTLIGYSGFIGFAGAVGFQGPQSAVQSTSIESDVPLGLAIILFAQNAGPAVFIAIAQNIFTTRLTTNLHHLVPGLDANSIENMGLGELKLSVGEENLERALFGFDESLVQTWYLAIGLTCMTMVGSLLMEWRSVKQKKS